MTTGRIFLAGFGCMAAVVACEHNTDDIEFAGLAGGVADDGGAHESGQTSGGAGMGTAEQPSGGAGVDGAGQASGGIAVGGATGGSLCWELPALMS